MSTWGEVREGGFRDGVGVREMGRHGLGGVGVRKMGRLSRMVVEYYHPCTIYQRYRSWDSARTGTESRDWLVPRGRDVDSSRSEEKSSRGSGGVLV